MTCLCIDRPREQGFLGPGPVVLAGPLAGSWQLPISQVEGGRVHHPAPLQGWVLASNKSGFPLPGLRRRAQPVSSQGTEVPGQQGRAAGALGGGSRAGSRVGSTTQHTCQQPTARPQLYRHSPPTGWPILVLRTPHNLNLNNNLKFKCPPPQAYRTI